MKQIFIFTTMLFLFDLSAHSAQDCDLDTISPWASYPTHMVQSIKPIYDCSVLIQAGTETEYWLPEGGTTSTIERGCIYEGVIDQKPVTGIIMAAYNSASRFTLLSSSVFTETQKQDDEEYLSLMKNESHVTPHENFDVSETFELNKQTMEMKVLIKQKFHRGFFPRWKTTSALVIGCKKISEASIP